MLSMTRRMLRLPDAQFNRIVKRYNVTDCGYDFLCACIYLGFEFGNNDAKGIIADPFGDEIDANIVENIKYLVEHRFELSVDNGLTWTHVNDMWKLSEEEFAEKYGKYYDAIAQIIPEEIRDDINAAYAPCSDRLFYLSCLEAMPYGIIIG